MVEGRSGEDVDKRRKVEDIVVEVRSGEERRGYSGRRKEWRGCRG